MAILKRITRIKKKRLGPIVALLMAAGWLLVTSVLWAVGNDTGGIGVNSAEETKAERALEELRRAYVERDLDGFFQNVAEDASFNSMDLKFNVSNAFRDTSQIDLDIFVDQSLKESDKVLLKAHWQKRAVNNGTGRLQITKGQVQFIFLTSGVKTQLIDMKGASPF